MKHSSESNAECGPSASQLFNYNNNEKTKE